MENPLDVISRRIVYPWYWRARGLSVGSLLEVYEKNQWLSGDELQDLQWRMLKKLLSHAYENTSFYRERMKKESCRPEDIRSLEDFARLPYLTKDDIISQGPRMISEDVKNNDLIKDSTGGSTGRNIHFYEDRCELSHRFTAGVRSDMWAGLRLGRKYTQIWGSPLDLDKASRIRRFVDKTLLRRLFISSFQLSDEDLRNAIKKIRSSQPKIIIGYPTPLCRLAEFIVNNNVSRLGIGAVISSAETLSDRQRKELEKAFTCKVFNRYGCREFGVIAAECEAHEGLHLFTDRFLVEFVDIKGIGDDRAKEIVVTDLHKFGMPFIRYRIGDIGVPSTEKCTCGRGFPLMQSVEGRTFDLIMGENGNYIAGTFWTLLFRQVKGIRQFRVVQPTINKLNINLEIEDSFIRTDLETLEKTIKLKCGHNMSVAFNIMERIPASPSGKFRFVISDVTKSRFEN